MMKGYCFSYTSYFTRYRNFAVIYRFSYISQCFSDCHDVLIILDFHDSIDSILLCTPLVRFRDFVRKHIITYDQTGRTKEGFTPNDLGSFN